MAVVRRVRAELLELAGGRLGEKPVAVAIPDPENLRTLKAYILSPQGAPTEGLIFRLNIDIPLEYPFKAPRITFETKIWHPRVLHDYGCRVVLRAEYWKPSTRLETILMSIQAMLADPGDVVGDKVLTLDPEATSQYLTDRSAYNTKAKEWAARSNCGYGHVTFEDLRVSALQSILRVPGVCRYEGSVFCQKGSTSWELKLVVVPQLKAYRQGVEELYPVTSQRRKLTGFEFDFEEDKITIDVRSEGTTSQDGCWQITPVHKLKIEKEAVDRFVPLKNSPPVCELRLMWLREEIKPQRLIHRFKVLGTKAPFDSFSICLDPKDFKGVQSLEQNVERPTLPELLRVPVKDGRRNISIPSEIGSRYFEFGVFLLNDTTGSKIESICREMRDNSEDIVRKILMEWLSGKGRQPVTWETLIQTLIDASLSTLAEDIRSAKFPNPSAV